MGEHQQNYYVREKALKNYIDVKGYHFTLSGGTEGVIINSHDLNWRLNKERLPVVYIAFNMPYKNKLVPIRIRKGKSRW